MSARLLVVRFSSLGDVVLVAPVFDALRAGLPNARITFLTRSEYAGLHASNPAVDQVWGFDVRRGRLRDLADRVRTVGFDRMVDLHGSLRSRVLESLTGLPVSRIGKQSGRRWLQVLPPPLKIRRPADPVVTRYLQAASEAGGADTAGSASPRLHLSPEQHEEGRLRASSLREGGGGRLMALLPGARHAAKRWPDGHFAHLANLVSSRGDRAVVVSAPEDPGSADRLQATAGGEGLLRVPLLPGPMALAGFLAACDGVVTNDSGPMHVAAAVGTPVVGLFGPTSPSLGFAPVGEKASALHLGLFCSPCSRHGGMPCWRGGRPCLTELEPEVVAAKLYGLIS